MTSGAVLGPRPPQQGCTRARTSTHMVNEETEAQSSRTPVSARELTVESRTHQH